MIRVVVVEDSLTVRRHLVSIFERSHHFKVVGAADSGVEAIRVVNEVHPDLVTLDVFLPGHNAAQVVRGVLSTRPMPIVLVSNAPKDTSEVFDALSAGALDVVKKPVANDHSVAAFLDVMRIYSRVKVRGTVRTQPGAPLRIVTIAASTGGPPAVQEFLLALGPDFPLPIVIAHHLAAGFEQGFAQWLEGSCQMRVRVAGERQALQPGVVWIGDPRSDLVIRDRQTLECRPAPSSGFHPSGDLLFTTAAEAFGAEMVAVVLTGMGTDGARGAKVVQELGGIVMAQDKTSCAVYGMPAAVIKARLARKQGSPATLGRAIVELMRRKSAESALSGESS